MRAIRVNKAALLEKVQANRATHKDTFERAVQEYRKRLEAHLEQMIDDCRHNRPVNHHIGMPVPEEHTGDYDRIIEMLEMSLDNEITLDESDAQMYLMDQWHWTAAFTGTTTAYLVN